VSPGLLQLTVLRHRRGSDEPAATVQNAAARLVSTLRPHHASATGPALASGSTSGGFQDGHPGLHVTARHGSSLSSCRLPCSWSPGRRQLRSTTSRSCVVTCETTRNYGDKRLAQWRI